jgi:hypothetical protein
MWHEFRLDNFVELFAFFSILSIYPATFLTNFFHKKFLLNEEKEERHLRGAKLISSTELNKIIKKFYGRKEAKNFLKIGDVLMPRNRENESFLLIGSPGSGKSVLLKNIINQLIEKQKNDEKLKMIVLDRKPEFVQIFKRKNDLIFYPKSSDSIKWDIGSELKTREDIRYFVESVIPLRADEKQPIFTLASQTIFETILLHLLDRDELNNKGLIDFLRVFSTPQELEKELKETQDRYALNLNFYLKDDNAFSASIMGTFLSNIAKQFILEDFYFSEGNFSIKDYLQNNQNQNLFILNPSKSEKFYSSYYVAFLSFFSRHIKSLSNNTDRRIWFILDEFQTLRKNNIGMFSILSQLAESRQKGSCMILATQSLQQVKNLYQNEGMQQILNNTATKIFLRNSSNEDQKIISEILGKSEVKQYTLTNKIGGDPSKPDQHNISSQIKEKKIILESEIGELQSKKIKNGMEFMGLIKIAENPVCKFSYHTQNFIEIYQIEEKAEQRGFDPILKPNNKEETEEKKTEDKKADGTAQARDGGQNLDLEF